MRRALVTRLEAIEDRRVERHCRTFARKEGMTAAEFDGYLAFVRREVARLRAGLRPRTFADFLEDEADDLGLTGDERAAFLAEMMAKAEAREAGQTNGV